MNYTMSQLKGMNRCRFRREHMYKTADTQNTFIIREALIKECILGFLGKEMSWQDVARRVKAEAYAGDKDFSEPTKEILENDLIRYIGRYVNSESRIPQPAPESSLDIYGVQVRVNPDLFFYDGNVLEIVKFQFKKPDLTNGRKLDASAAGSLPLYALLYYGKQLNAYINPEKKPIQVKASFYYLKKANDNFEKDIFDLDFFELKNGKNIVSIMDSGTYPSAMDTAYYSLFQDFVAGSQMAYNEAICKHCQIKGICQYTKTPEPDVRDSVTKPITKIHFTDDQIKAIQFENGIARINAGAGAGKTMVISMRVVELLKKGYSPKDICVLSFTNAAAEEMTERIKRYNQEAGLGDAVDINQITSMTFNSFGDTCIKSNYSLLGFTAEPILIEEGEKSRIIEKLLTENVIEGLNYRSIRANERYLKGALAIAKKIFDIFKAYCITQHNVRENMGTIMKKLDVDSKNITEGTVVKLAGLHDLYRQELKGNNYIEYSDQEWMILDIWQKNPSYFQASGFRHIIVDEFQDSNEKQMNIIKILCQSSVFTSLMVVGDDSQAIYGFRDTTPDNIIQFFDRLGVHGCDFFLLENHRSTPEIISLANSVNALNANRIPKDLRATKTSIGKHPVVEAYYRQEEEYRIIVKRMKEKLAEGRKPEEIAFITMSKSELLKMQELLNQENIPCILLTPEPTKMNPKVQGVQALYSFLTHPEDEAGIAVYLNCLSGGNFVTLTAAEQNAVIAKYQEYSLNFQGFTDAQKYEACTIMAERLGKNEKDEVFEHFMEVAKHNRTWFGLSGYLYNFGIYGDEDSYSKKLSYPGITLTTAHSSKGLEWPVVFNSITKYDNQIIRQPDKGDELEERRRLLFVSITRAQEELYISGKYYSFGTAKDKDYNIFLKECYEIMGKNMDAEYNGRSAA